MADAPDRLPPLLLESLRAYRSGDSRRSAELARSHLQKLPNDAAGLRILAISLENLGKYSGAVEAAARTLAVNAGDRPARLVLIRAHARMGDYDAARAAAGEALRAFPGDVEIHAMQAEVMFDEGDFAGAEAAITPVLTSGGDHPAVAQAFAKICGRVKRHREGVTLAEKCLDKAKMEPMQRASLLIAVGHLHDALGEYDRAFEAFSKANALKMPRPFVAEYAASFETMLAEWTPRALEAAPRSGVDSEVPVYIVGMPRSGTSLTEQILASHPRVFGAGELLDVSRAVTDLRPGEPGPHWHLKSPRGLQRKDVERLGKHLLESLKGRAPGRLRVSDKYPMNCMHLGAISLLLPGARVIHCRRDPIDTCLSCFFTNLVGPHAFNCDLVMLGRWYKQHERVMAHWRSVLPLRIYDAKYETQVEDQEGESKRLIEFLGLPWDDSCLKFYETSRVTLTPSADQVRQPIYRKSIQRWKNYERHLGPLIEALGAG